MKKIPLTQSKFALIDDDDFEKASKFKWCAYRASSGAFYAHRGCWNRKIGKQTSVYLARFIMNAPKGILVDHINHDTLDNRKANLRLCDRAGNRSNSKLNKINSSGLKGVWFRKSTGNWLVQIQHNKRKRHVGVFPTAKIAAKAYDKAAKLLHGEFACTNKSLGLL